MAYKYIPNPQFQQQAAARQAQKKLSAPAVSSAQPIQPPAPGTPYSPQPAKRKPYDHASELRNAARSVHHSQYKGDPVSAWRANPYEAGAAPRFTDPPKPGPSFDVYRPGTAQPVGPPSPGTPYNPGGGSAGDWRDPPGSRKDEWQKSPDYRPGFDKAMGRGDDGTWFSSQGEARAYNEWLRKQGTGTPPSQPARRPQPPLSDEQIQAINRQRDEEYRKNNPKWFDERGRSLVSEYGSWLSRGPDGRIYDKPRSLSGYDDQYLYKGDGQPSTPQPNPRQTAIEDLFRRNNVNMPSGFMDQLLQLLGGQAPPPQLPPDFEGPLPGPRDPSPGLPPGPRTPAPESPVERAERFRREQQLNSRWEYYRNLPEEQQRAAQYDPAAQRELAELTEWRRTGKAPASVGGGFGGGGFGGGGFGFPSGGFGGGGMDPMQQMWQQSMNAWTMPKQQLLGWGQQMQQMPWGPNYGNTTDRPDPWSQQVSGPFGSDYGNMFGNMSGFIQAVNNQAMQKPVGVYQGQGNPGSQYGRVNYDIRSLINQGNQMVQDGWQNPFMAQPGGGGSQPGGSQQRPGLTDDGQWIAADGTRLGNQQAGMDYDQYLKGDRSVPWSVYSRTPRHLRGTNPNSWTDSQWREYQDARHYEPEDVGGLYRGQDGNVYLSGGMPVPGRDNSPTRIMPSSGRPGAAQPIQQPSQGTQYPYLGRLQ